MLFEGKCLGGSKKVGWLTFKLHRVQFPLTVLSYSTNLGEHSEINLVFLFQCHNKFLLQIDKGIMYFPIGTLLADTYLYLFYFCRDPCSSMKPGVHTIGRSVGRRALFIIYSLFAFKMAFSLLSLWKSRVSNAAGNKDFPMFQHRYNCIVLWTSLIIDCQKWNVLKVCSSKKCLKHHCHLFCIVGIITVLNFINAIITWEMWVWHEKEE